MEELLGQAGAARATKAGSQSMPMDEVQAEVNAVRRARKAGKGK